MYSNIYFRSKSRVPVVLVFLAGVSMFSFFLFFFGTNSQPTRATKKNLKQHEIVNLSPSEAGIFWETEKKEVGWVVYGERENTITSLALDERDSENKRFSSIYHYIPLKNLLKDKTYYYKIVSDREVVSDKNGKVFQLHTLRNIPSGTALRPAYGKILQANGQPADNVLVLYIQSGFVPLLALTKTTGEWLIPLQYMVNKATNEPLLLLENSVVRLEVLTDDAKPTTITAPIKRTNPLPQSIIEGQSYELKNEEGVLGTVATASSIVNLKEIDIIFPREGAVVPATRPLLKGVALPGHEVTISLDAKPAYATKILADKNGEWRLDLSLQLPAGSYKLSATTDNASARKITVSRKFSVGKSGEQVLAEATKSATVAPATPTPTLLPTATPASLPNTGFTPTPSVLANTGFASDFLFYASFAFIILGTGFLIVF